MSASKVRPLAPAMIFLHLQDMCLPSLRVRRINIKGKSAVFKLLKAVGKSTSTLVEQMQTPDNINQSLKKYNVCLYVYKYNVHKCVYAVRIYVYIRTAAPLTGANTTAIIFVKSTESCLCPACANFLVSSLTHQGSRLKVIRFLPHCKYPVI